MTDIGVLTYHNNENRGAILQAYALCELLEDTFDTNVDLIEYRTKSKERDRRNSLFISKHLERIVRTPQRVRDRRIIETFLDDELPTSEESIVTDNHQEAVKWLNKQSYNLLVTGSDEIWKINEQKNTNIRSKIFPSRPFPNLYFLDPSISAVKASYAASANKTDINTLSSQSITKFKKHIGEYKHISVRDRHTKNILNELGVNDVTLVPDPTLMVEIPTRNVDSIFRNLGIDPRKPILGFHGPNQQAFKEICHQYRERGFQIVTPRSSPFADIELEGVVDPFEYYTAYQYFDMVVTNSLHSTIFSLKHGVPFVTIDTDSIYESIQSKTHSLLQDVSMTDRHISAVDGDVSEFYEDMDRLEQSPDQSHIESQVSKLRDRGFDYLERVEKTL
ncbi:polysaccharide pyruvyl transferase family protein [Natronorubrum texcoconense]|uniref:Polysaccharide pyruvyl transferase n=1 Tax=Natronorubrum texcoconense TaxID=1095776 RepID=A0A1G8VQC7_9EURY|nr:polysaccharide pyruvyl transferase family protein [Natronorubrum texcoconense]SDJ68077.1 Polysaccharide pyruvyl transferase [Natronorubrum texcoconense]